MRKVSLHVDGVPLTVSAETTAAAAVLISGGHFTRISVSGERRAPLCGMGICFECRLTIDGRPHQRSCQILCESGMDIRTA
jgi:D-hydroxyproline dehydrogenase subunit gamma